MNPAIIRFLQGQSCATVCCVNEQGKPWCFNCFYAFNEAKGLLYFKSSSNSYHSNLLKNNTSIAGTILPDILNILLTKGLQFEGKIIEQTNDDELFKNYYKKHPMALAMPGDLWTIFLNTIKMTDSTLGFGKKISWIRMDYPVTVQSKVTSLE